MIKKPQIKFPSELRLDVVSKDWVVVAKGREKLLLDFLRKGKRKIIKLSSKICPFCQIQTQEKPIFGLNNSEEAALPDIWPPKRFADWTTILIPNKYPAFSPEAKIRETVEGELYQRLNAVGFHELVISREHDKSPALLSVERVKEMIDIYQKRYLELAKNSFVNHISIFYNHGVEAGASQPHPHSQLITTPLIDIDLRQALSNAEKYFKTRKKCVYCQMSAWEKKIKKRLVFENQGFLVTCPFASKAAFEMIITPKKHSAYFERIADQEKWQLAEALKTALYKLYKGLGDPAYNFYLHTAPCDGKTYDYYHWHWTILPKTKPWAGFEIGTRIEISAIEPEKAAEYLRKQ